MIFENIKKNWNTIIGQLTRCVGQDADCYAITRIESHLAAIAVDKSSMVNKGVVGVMKDTSPEPIVRVT